MELNKLTIKEAREGLDAKNFSALDLAKACLARIKERNEKINAFITVCEDSAIAEAIKADEMIAQGKVKPLTGIPFAVKDAICTKDIRSTGAAKILDNYFPPYEATVIRKIREQGAVLVGKNNCDAFGHGASNENSMYGPVHNPYNENKVAGGSSGGSAAAVADHMCLFSIAEDTGGSIRQPASFCGVVGLRPSYGLNSRYGIMPMASSLDTVGPITKTVYDAALVAEQMAGKDKKDATTVSSDVSNYTENLGKSLSGLRVGVPSEYFEMDGMDKEISFVIREKIDQLVSLGCHIVDVSLPYTQYAIPVYYILVPSEDSSNLGRLDGIRYGVQAEGKDLYEIYAKSRAIGFPDEVKRRIMIGTYALSAGYYDAYYRKAQKVRTLIRRDFEQVFHNVDVLITPTSPFAAFDIGAKKENVLAMYLADFFVSPGAIAGIPGLSVPAGMTKDGLPFGMQIMGPRLREDVVFNVANFLEKN